MSAYEHVMDTLRTTSRTFFIPIRAKIDCTAHLGGNGGHG